MRIAQSPHIKSIRLENFLSFKKSTEVELHSLNVLIGPNGSGKSNFVQAFVLLRNAPKDIFESIRLGGGMAEWISRGALERIVRIEARVKYLFEEKPLRYLVALSTEGTSPYIHEEVIEDIQKRRPSEKDVYFYFRNQNGVQTINVRENALEENGGDASLYISRRLEREDLSPSFSVLKQKVDKDFYPELTYLNRTFDEFRIFKDWTFGEGHPARKPQNTDLPSSFLLESATNLAMVMNNLSLRSPAREKLKRHFDTLYEGIQDVRVDIVGSTIQLMIQESSNSDPVPAYRLSDGTIRFLMLLAVLSHPTPPKLICIEEPELGLHPDVIRDIADLLVDASTRTQVIVTTHSPTLLSALSDRPECVLVCSKDESGTKLERLDKSRLVAWGDDYSLGHLWASGAIGGNRW